MLDQKKVASACAKIILFGEHAVVYGEPAIALPVPNLRSYVTIQENNDFLITAKDLNKQFSLEDSHPVSTISRLTLESLNITSPPSIHLIIHSDIPIASGLGSGAAVSTAICRAISNYVDSPLTYEQVNKLVYEVEKIHHGTPSGIDNTVIVYEKPIYYRRGHSIKTLSPARLQFLIGDTGTSASTKEAVSDVRKLVETQPEIKTVIGQIGKITEQARKLLGHESTQSLGKLMRKNHLLLQKLNVSSEQLDQLVGAAIEAGALGAKLSGGGRGGNMIALVTDDTLEKVKFALLEAGAKRVFVATLEGGTDA